jgi:hypothetical protein
MLNTNAAPDTLMSAKFYNQPRSQAKNDLLVIPPAAGAVSSERMGSRSSIE